MFENWGFERRSHCRGEEMHYSAGIRKQKGKKKEKKKRSVNSGILIEAFKYLKKKDECEKVERYFFL